MDRARDSLRIRSSHSTPEAAAALADAEPVAAEADATVKAQTAATAAALSGYTIAVSPRLQLHGLVQKLSSVRPVRCTRGVLPATLELCNLPVQRHAEFIMLLCASCMLLLHTAATVPIQP